MTLKTITLASFFTFFFIFFLIGVTVFGQNSNNRADVAGGDVQTFRKQMDSGLFKDAFDSMQRFLDSDTVSAETAAEVFPMAVQCLLRLNRVNEIDTFRETVVTKHSEKWPVLLAAAESLAAIPSYGYLIEGKFERGDHRGGGEYVNSVERDRIRALQLLRQAIPLVEKDPNTKKVANFYQTMAAAWIRGNGGQTAWRLQLLTDLETLPDYEPGWGGYRTQAFAPVDTEGNPVYYRVPTSFQTAVNDGERWRYFLSQRHKIEKDHYETLRVAEFSLSQFGVETMRAYGFWRGGSGGGFGGGDGSGGGNLDTNTGIFAVQTLTDGETIAKLATGIKRFVLPDDQNYIVLYRQVADTATGNDKTNALEQLAGIYSNRKQYPMAAKLWKQLLDECPKEDVYAMNQYQRQYDQIVGHWGRFEPITAPAAGSGNELSYIFRNGKKVTFTAKEIDVPKLIADIQSYLKSNPQQLDWNKLQIDQIGYRLLQNDSSEQKYLGKEVARWELNLSPRENHFDRRVTVATPLTKGGAYLIQAKMTDGNTDNLVLWINDTAIVSKPLDGGKLYFVGDAATGAPVAGANLEFFGYKTQQIRNTPQFNVLTTVSKRMTDKFGLTTIDEGSLAADCNWLITATTPSGRLAFLGFNSIWYSRSYQEEYNETKAFFISDRPVYRPLQDVEFKFWVSTAKYDLPDTYQVPFRSVKVVIRDPKDDTILSKTYQLGAAGDLADKITLPADATLGVYQVAVMTLDENQWFGDGTFRVEEYKKPEFEVTVNAPKEPLKLGEPLTATIAAKYYFGSPVTNGTVKYKVMRETHDTTWFPIGPWDWLYGNGYGWLGCDYDWYPGFIRWGCRRPIWSWLSPRYSGPPEVVAEQEVPIGEDGTVQVTIDTNIAKELFPGRDQKYTITAEVTDQSRRTIVGNGSVFAAAVPFRMTTWVDRGYYETNRQVVVQFQTRRLDGKPVTGDVKVTLYSIQYELSDSEKNPSGGSDVSGVARSNLGVTPIEKVVLTEMVRLDETGRGRLSLNSGQTGQYRVACQLDGVEGATIFSVFGNENVAGSFEFNQLELTPDKVEFAPGEKVNLRVNTQRPNSTVLLFWRAASGVYTKPEVLQLDGKTAIVQTEITLRDMPNMYVEAVTISDGQIFTEVKELVIPPEKRIVNVEVLPVVSPEKNGKDTAGKDTGTPSYKPGETMKAQVKITGLDGKPVVGDTVVAIYDKSVEAIAGGSNIADIREFFWKWRRWFSPNSESNLGKICPNFGQPGKPGMGTLGIFGDSITMELQNGIAVNGMVPRMARGAAGGYGGAMESMDMMSDSSMPMSSMSKMAGAPAPMAPMGPGGNSDGVDFLSLSESDDEDGGGTMVEATVRQNFADTALWVASLKTNSDGIADIELAMPENLTTWKIKVWSLAPGTRVGSGETEVITRKDLILRMQIPRFLTQKDTAVLTANVHNYLDTAKDVQVSLELANNGPLTFVAADTATGSGDTTSSSSDTTLKSMTKTVRIEPAGEARVDWEVAATGVGEVVIVMKALTNIESDAMQLSIPVQIHGMLKQEAWSSAIPPTPTEGTTDIRFRVPVERKPESTVLTVRVSPTLAGAMVEAVPYLVKYPYGCTEQTLNRFLPAVIAQKLLIEMGVDLDTIAKSQTNLNAQELGSARDRAAQWQKKNNAVLETDSNPVFSRVEMNKIVNVGVARLAEMQLSDGGWGWFSGYGERSTLHNTALIVHGLKLAAENDVFVDPDMLQRGVVWLTNYQKRQLELLRNGDKRRDEMETASPEKKKELQKLPYKDKADNSDALCTMVMSECNIYHTEMLEYLWRDRTSLSMYGVALAGLTYSHMASDKVSEMSGSSRAAACVQMLEQYLVVDTENQTAFLNLSNFPGWCFWTWYGSEYETQASYLMLLMRTNPKSQVAPQLVKYLLNNRKHATYWNSTRDTAVCVEAFAKFLKATGEDKPNMTLDIFYDGKLTKTLKITPDTLFSLDNTLVLVGDEVSDGDHKVSIVKRGTGPVCTNVYLEKFTLEDPITGTGLEVKVSRKYYRLTPDTEATASVAGGRGQAVSQRIDKYIRTAIPNLGATESGDLVEVELTVESKNDYESILIEDMKAAGFEPVEQRSGYNGNSMGAYVEYRDNRVSFFVSNLSRGKHSVSYRLRAEQPGSYSALPAVIWGMYSPELKGNSDEWKINIR